MTPRLKQITIQDFRCISGKATIPLDASVVLIHGPNGTGKTSVLSAIELALTGEVSALQRLDANYLSHIVHRNRDHAEITLRASGLESEQGQTTLTIRKNEVYGKPLLDKAMGHVFNERCNLAQSTLGRLLEIYQYASAREDSQLTRFVKDLLGLDRLEALIDGLDSAGDVRNTRKLAPKYKEAEDRKHQLAKAQADDQQQLFGAQNVARNLKAKLIQQLAILSRPLEPSLSLTDKTAELEKFFIGEPEGERLVILSQKRRELAGIQAEWQLLGGTDSIERSAVEASERNATNQANEWRDTYGTELERILDELRDTFPDLPSSASTDPELARNTGLELATAEARRCDELIAQSDSVTNEIATLEQALAGYQSRSRLLDEQISAIASDSESLSRSLAALIPHIQNEDCPVCGRDFAEVSAEPLVSHLSARIAHLTEQSGRLQALTAEKTNVTAGILQAERALDIANKRQISPEVRVSLKRRAARLAESVRTLTELSSQTVDGVVILRRAATEQKRLAELRIRDQRATEVRAAIASFGVEMGLPPMGKANSLDEAISDLQKHLSDEETRLKDSQTLRQAARLDYRNLLELEKDITSRTNDYEARAKLVAALEREFATAEKRRLDGRNIASAARDVRTTIVTRVFNNSLNTIWRDLFVRLAPAEPFVPAFKVPDSGRSVMAVLETVHRDGDHGGTPGAMLSAGNLNTAALTLFLALHLSASAPLPWLILDDPVQSMDEVHIIQFAALLRTISKGHSRQIVIAVHDRPLFEYLALELSPAFQSDELITVELSRNLAGATIADPVFRIWEPDAVVVA